MYHYQFTDPALKQLKKLSTSIQKRLIKKLDYYCQQKHPLRYAHPLTDFRLGSFRFRTGEYRLIFDVEDETLTILLVGHRREIYRK